MPLSLHSTSLCHLSDEAVERELKIVQNKLLGMAQMKALASRVHLRLLHYLSFNVISCLGLSYTCCQLRQECPAILFGYVWYGSFLFSQSRAKMFGVLDFPKELYSIVQSRCWQAFEDKLAGHKWCAAVYNFMLKFFPSPI